MNLLWVVWDALVDVNKQTPPRINFKLYSVLDVGILPQVAVPGRGILCAAA